MRTIKKKTKKLERIPTGIPNLDTLIQSGFIRNSTNLVSGDAGSGKTILAIQFLVHGITKCNEPGIYITFEEKKEEFYQTMLSLGWDLEKLEKQGKFIFLEYTPEQVKNVLVEGGGTIETAISKIKAKRVVIDSISSFALLYTDELKKQQAALNLFDLISKWDCTALLTAQGKPGGKNNGISTSLEFEVDSIIILYHRKIKGIRKRAIEILKMRGTKIPEKTFELIINNRGISINTRKTISF